MILWVLMEQDWFVVVWFYVQLNMKVLFVVDVEVQVNFVKVLRYDGIFIYGVFLNGEVQVMVMLYLMLNVIYGGCFYGLIENVVFDKVVRGLGFV